MPKTRWRIAVRIARSALLIYVLVSVAGAILLASVALHPPRRPIDETQDQRELFSTNKPDTIRIVEIRGEDGTTLRGWYAVPQQDNGDLVLLLHGLADNRLGVAGYAHLFLAHGYRVLLPDSRAHGISGGKFASYGVLERIDVHRWLDWAQIQGPTRCVYGFGESMGAAVLLQALDDRFCAAVVESPFESFREIAAERVGQYFNLGPWFGRSVGRPMVELGILYARLRYGMNLAHANPTKGLKDSHTPVLLIHGSADSDIQPLNSVDLHRAAPDHTELWIVPRATHSGAIAVQPAEFERRVINWLAAHDHPPNADH